VESTIFKYNLAFYLLPGFTLCLDGVVGPPLLRPDRAFGRDDHLMDKVVPAKLAVEIPKRFRPAGGLHQVRPLRATSPVLM